MILHVDPGSGLPLYRQLVQQVKLAIARGAIGPGDQLPSVRAVSAALSVNPATVQKAWQELEREGVAEMRRGLGMFVTLSAGRAGRAEARRALEETAAQLAAEAIALGLEPDDVHALVLKRMCALRTQRGDHGDE